MNRSDFWKIIAQSDVNGADQAEVLENVLAQRPADAIRAFAVHWGELMNEAYRRDLWAAAYVILGGCSDDGFTDFRYWLIGRGEAVYRAARSNPDTLVGAASESFPSYEELGYAAHRAYESVTGEELHFERDPVYPELTGPTWETEDDLARLLPELWHRFAPEWHSDE